MKLYVLPELGNKLLVDIVPLDIEKLLQGCTKLSAGSVRNIVVMLQSIFSFALDNDMITSSPVRKRHKPPLRRSEKPSWTPAQVRQIIDAVPTLYQSLFTCVALDRAATRRTAGTALAGRGLS